MLDLDYCLLYIKSKFLLAHAAAEPQGEDVSDKDNSVRSKEQRGKRIGLGMTAEGYLKSAVNELTRGNYEVSMGIINKGMDACQEEQQVMALLELKSIIARLRLQCNTAQKLLLLGPTSKSNALPNTFSLEMLDVVQKVLRCRNHYEMLRISHHASYSEVKRAYKRLALRLHPDKNRSPGAAEAFRRINEAADTLTDQQKRIAYNMLTAVGDCFGRQQEQSEQEIETELQTESEHQPSRVYQPANQRQPQRQALYQTEQLIIGLTAAVIFILITVQYLTASSVYSLTPSSTHNVRLISQTRRVPYFVEPEFLEQQTSEQLRQLEHEIEQLYLTDLRQSCKQERKIRDNLLQRARLTNNINLRDHALKMPMIACHAFDKLDEL